jgi:hypothetical protein
MPGTESLRAGCNPLALLQRVSILQESDDGLLQEDLLV